MKKGKYRKELDHTKLMLKQAMSTIVKQAVEIGNLREEILSPPCQDVWCSEEIMKLKEI